MPSVMLRFLWKEYRTLRGLWLGLFALAAFVMTVIASAVTPTERSAVLLGSSFLLSTLFAAGAPVMLFAVERDDGTVRFLRSLPERQWAAFLGKMSAAILSCLALLAATSLLALCFSGGGVPSREHLQDIPPQGFLLMAEALVCATCASLVCSHPMMAALFGIAAAALSSQLSMALTNPRWDGLSLIDYQRATPARLGVVALMASVDILLGSRWLWRSNYWRLHDRLSSASLEAPRTVASLRATRRGMVWRLLWQTLRESWKAMLIAFVGVLFLTFAVEVLCLTYLNPIYRYIPRVPWSVLFVPALFGALAFRNDQRQERYRFLANHAGPPRMVWFARQAIWFLPVLLWYLVLQYIGGGAVRLLMLSDLRRGGFSPWSMEPLLWTSSHYAQGLLLWEITGHLSSWFWAGTLAAFALGQLCSLLFRSAILAGLFALGTSIVLLVWCYVAGAWWLSAVWFVLPIAAGAWIASWFRVRDWLVDRNGWIRWTATVVALVLPVVIVIAGVPAARMRQVSTPFPAQFVYRNQLSTWAAEAKQEQIAGRTLFDAYQLLTANLEEGQDPQAIAEKVIQLSRERAAIPDSPAQQNRGKTWFGWALNQLLLDQMRRSQKDGDLERTLDLMLAHRRLNTQIERGHTLSWGRETIPSNAPLLRWATSPGQNPELLARAITELEEVDSSQATPSVAIVNDYLRALSIIRDDAPPESLRIEYILNRLPGERRRAEVALEHLALFELDYATFVEEAFRGEGSRQTSEARADELRELMRHESGAALMTTSTGQHDLMATLSQARAAANAATSYLLLTEFFSPDRLRDVTIQWLRNATIRRAERVRLALIAYHIDHDTYPDSLAQLAPSYIAAAELIDPYSGAIFEYQPHGFTLPTSDGNYGELVDIPANTPLLWSVGVGNSAPVERKLVITRDERGRHVRSMPNTGEQQDDWEVATFMVLSPRDSKVARGGPPVILELPTDLPLSEPVATPDTDKHDDEADQPATP